MAEVMNTPFGDVDPAAVDAATATAEKSKIEEITIKFAKGLCGEPFMSKNGVELVRIQIPNKDPNDHTPWAEFVLAKKSVHENQYGKGLWAKIPADGHTTVSKSFLAGQDENGKNIWEKDKRSVPNRERKEMVEFYKERGEAQHESASADRESGSLPEKAEEEGDREMKSERRSIMKDIEAGKKELAEKKAPAKTKAKTKEAEL